MREQRLHAFGIAIGLCLFSAPANANCTDPFADPNTVVELHLETTTAVWSQLSASEMEGAGCEAQFPYFEAGFRCGDQEPSIRIGIRKKRDRSASDFKPPIKLDFNRFVEGQRWPTARGELGFRKLSLNSGQPDDPESRGSSPESAEGVLSALITEHLSWRLMREEVPESSGVAYAKLTLHFTDTGEEQYQGLHVLIEDIDRTSVRSRFTVDNGALWKTTSPSCRNEVVYDDGAPNSATMGFDTWLALNPGDFAGTWYERTNQAMHLDMLLRQEALRELLVNTADTVLGKLNNYFALDVHGERRRYLPWDLDDMFRPQPQIHPPETPLLTSCVGNGSNCAPVPIGTRIRDNPEIRTSYLQALCNVTNGTGHEEKILADMAAIDARIRPLVAQEKPLWEPLGLDPLDENTPGTYAAEVIRMRTWIPARVRAVRQLIASEGVECQAGCDEGATLHCEALGVTRERVCKGGIWGPCTPPPPRGVDGVAGAPSGGSGGAQTGTGGTGGAATGTPPLAGVAGGAREPSGTGGATTAGTSSVPSEPVASNAQDASGCACKLGGGTAPRGSLFIFLFALLFPLRRTRPLRKVARRVGVSRARVTQVLGGGR